MKYTKMSLILSILALGFSCLTIGEAGAQDMYYFQESVDDSVYQVETGDSFDDEAVFFSNNSVSCEKMEKEAEKLYFDCNSKILGCMFRKTIQKEFGNTLDLPSDMIQNEYMFCLNEIYQHYTLLIRQLWGDYVQQCNPQDLTIGGVDIYNPCGTKRQNPGE